MTPAWVCFDWDPREIAKNAYAGLIVDGQRLIPERALLDGNFEVIVSGLRKGVGSSRETAAQCEAYAGIRIAIAASFAPIHARNNINLGTLMGDHAMLARLQRGEGIPLAEFTRGCDADHAAGHRVGRASSRSRRRSPRASVEAPRAGDAGRGR